MKNTLILLSLGLLTMPLLVSADEVRVKSELKEVTVYLSGASLTSKGNFSAGDGTNDIVFENLSPVIDPNSIQVKGEGEFTILGVTFRTNYLSTQSKPRDLKQLEDSLELIQLKLETQRNMRNVYESEESFLLSNKNIGGQNTGVIGAELERIANLLRARLPELKALQQECKIKERKLNEEVSRLQGQLAEWNSKRNKNTGEIVVNITSRANVNGKLTVVYMVGNAGWSPAYDLRAKSINEPVKLDLRGNITQNTGMDWNNVKLTLSTGNPSESGTQPVVNPWWLSYYTPQVYKRNRYNAPAAVSKTESLVIGGNFDEREEQKSKDADYAAQYVEVEENATNISYEISIPYTIPSDNKMHSASIQNYSIPASYRYYCAPKYDQDAFLLARITGWDKYNLLSGEMNIFFEDNFVGKSALNVRSTSDTLDLSMGRDKNVSVKRILLKDLCEKKIIGSTKKDSRMIEISVRNKKKADIDLEIVDQIPLSKNSEIEVELLESSKARYDKETGLLSWTLKLNSSEEKKMKFGFSVKYPKDKMLSNF